MSQDKSPLTREQVIVEATSILTKIWMEALSNTDIQGFAISELSNHARPTFRAEANKIITKNPDELGPDVIQEMARILHSPHLERKITSS